MTKRIEYRVKPVQRFIITRWEGNVSRDPNACYAANPTAGSTTQGEYQTEALAHRVARALCIADQTEHPDAEVIAPTRPDSVKEGK